MYAHARMCLLHTGKMYLKTLFLVKPKKYKYVLELKSVKKYIVHENSLRYLLSAIRNNITATYEPLYSKTLISLPFLDKQRTSLLTVIKKYQGKISFEILKNTINI